MVVRDESTDGQRPSTLGRDGCRGGDRRRFRRRPPSVADGVDDADSTRRLAAAITFEDSPDGPWMTPQQGPLMNLHCCRSSSPLARNRTVATSWTPLLPVRVCRAREVCREDHRGESERGVERGWRSMHYDYRHRSRRSRWATDESHTSFARQVASPDDPIWSRRETRAPILGPSFPARTSAPPQFLASVEDIGATSSASIF